jgi:hypothetical protein
MVTEALFGRPPGLVLAWPAPLLLALGRAAPATPAGDDAAGDVPLSPAE